jgi:TPR repeat protein
MNCLNLKTSVFLILLLTTLGCKTYVPQLNSEVLAKAQNGNAEAQFEMGKTYFESFWKQPLLTKNGTGTKNRDEAFFWFEKAANQDHNKAKYYLHTLSSPKSNYECPIDCIEKAALEGIAYAQYTLGGSYLDDEHGTPKDLSLAFKWISLARQGDYQNKHRLISLYWLVQYYKISHLEISKGQKMAKEHTEKYGPSKSMYPEK